MGWKRAMLEMMKSKTCCAMVIGLCLLARIIPTTAQEKTQKPQTISTTPKVIVGRLQAADGKTFDVRGQVTFSITAMNSDYSLAGALVYTIPDDVRKIIAQRMGKLLADLPASINKKEVIANFEKDAHCPEIHLVFSSVEMELAGIALRFDRFRLTLDETPQELSQLFCVLTRQINSVRSHPRGAISRINQLLKGEETDKEERREARESCK
jgi:hypothetical protein